MVTPFSTDPTVGWDPSPGTQSTLQPLREVLLQICCRCSHWQQLVQFMIAGLRVWFEAHDSVEAAIRREKQIRNGNASGYST